MRVNIINIGKNKPEFVIIEGQGDIDCFDVPCETLGIACSNCKLFDVEKLNLDTVEVMADKLSAEDKKSLRIKLDKEIQDLTEVINNKIDTHNRLNKLLEEVTKEDD